MPKLKIILASGSQARKNIISSLNFLYTVIPADIDEKSIQDNDPAKRAEMIAIAKAEKIAQTEKAIIIAADTFCVHESGRVLEKPENIDEAKEMLRLQSNSADFIYSGFCYIDKINNFRFSKTAITKINFRKFSETEIDSYIKNMPVLTWSGAFYPGIPYGASLIKEVEGSLSSFLYGLPTELLIPQLEKSGIEFSPKQES